MRASLPCAPVGTWQFQWVVFGTPVTRAWSEGMVIQTIAGAWAPI